MITFLYIVIGIIFLAAIAACLFSWWAMKEPRLELLGIEEPQEFENMFKRKPKHRSFSKSQLPGKLVFESVSYPKDLPKRKRRKPKPKLFRIVKLAYKSATDYEYQIAAA